MNKNPFSDLPQTASEHFKLFFYAAVLHTIEHVSRSRGSFEAAMKEFPFLSGYQNELVKRGLEGKSMREAAEVWKQSILAWEQNISTHLPLRAVREDFNLDYAALTMLMTMGLVEEDSRFGLVFETFPGQAGRRRASAGLLATWWSGYFDQTDVSAVLRTCVSVGLLQVFNQDAPRPEWEFSVPITLWNIMRGEILDGIAPGVTFTASDSLLSLSEIILEPSVKQDLSLLPNMLSKKQIGAIVLRGPSHNSRRTVMGAIAKSIDRGLLVFSNFLKPDDPTKRILGPLASLLNALPTVVIETSGETPSIERPQGYSGPIGIIVGKLCSVTGSALERATSITLEIPDSSCRKQHWSAILGLDQQNQSEILSQSFRLTSGNIRRIALMAKSKAALAERRDVLPRDAQEAASMLRGASLDNLAVRVPAFGTWSHLAVDAATFQELRHLENRCTFREQLCSAVGEVLKPQLNAGVRALLCGPSGAGKSHAARILASVLHKDLFRLDLSSVVNKYIGETEKNLNRVFALAEELDVVLLIDEGDALLTQRTNVQSSNDRYANMETNFLLQRLETFEGILIMTTNAVERIDTAFLRRIDIVVDFRLPEANERLTIWNLHLPEGHAVDESVLWEIASRCELSGGSIKNAVLHATMLALTGKTKLTSEHLVLSVQREFRKIGAVCPLRKELGIAN